MVAVKQGLLDTVLIPPAPLDVLAQQMIAEVSAREWKTDELFDTDKIGLALSVA